MIIMFQSGDARVAMIGFPSVGKSTLLSTITKTESAQASYEFTTLTCIPGVIEYKNANIQVVPRFTTDRKIFVKFGRHDLKAASSYCTFYLPTTVARPAGYHRGRRPG